jgi:hypothetical protein
MLKQASTYYMAAAFLFGGAAGEALAAHQYAAVGFVSADTITARVPAAMTQCEQFSDRSRRAQCLAWTITTGEDL